MNRRVFLALAGWAAGACVATGVGVTAVSLLGEGISDSAARPLSSADVRRALDQPAEASESPAGTSTPAPPSTARPAAGQSRVLDTAGGTVVAGCAGDQATLTSWSPAQGFHGEVVERGPAPVVSVKFESSGTEILVTVDCASGVPQAHTRTDDRGHHRGKG
ncbi:MAG TPA: hypothetical protein VF069_04755 [Streptosporangiaceae bacterium]